MKKPSATFLAAVMIAFSVITLGLAIGSPAFAGHVTLSSGETITIQPNVATTVICNGETAPQNCPVSTVTLRNSYDVCRESKPASTCFEITFVKVFQKYPQCKPNAFDVCFETCKETRPASSCFDFCHAF